MTNSGRKKDRIWKKESRDIEVTSPNLPIRPSNSFMEKALRDCLKPRRHRSVTSRIKSVGSRGHKNSKSYQHGRYVLMADDMNATPPRSINDSGHYETRNVKRSNDVKGTTPLRSSYYQKDDNEFLIDNPQIISRRSGPIQSKDYGPSNRNARTKSPPSFERLDNAPSMMIPRSSEESHLHQHRNRISHLSSSTLSSYFQEEREQALRDYKVTIEYKHLKSHAPGGVYLIPSMDSLRNFNGVIFVRRGPFTNGIFKFRLSLPPKYNDTNMWPSIIFTSRVYNPYVNEKTGELDVQSAYPTWDPSRHYLVTVLTYLKKIFYSKNFTDAKANPAARDLAEKDPQAYKKNVENCVHESQKKVYVNEKGSTARFTEEEVAHRVLRDLLKHHIRSENQVTKQTVLAQIEKARKV